MLFLDGALLDLLEEPGLLADVDVLLDAQWEGAEDHARYRSWLEGVAKADEAFGLSGRVL